MKIYLAGKYSRKQEFLGYAAELVSLGHDVVSSWLWTSLDDPQAKAVELATESIPQEEGEYFAGKDLADLYSADLMIIFTEPARAEGKDRGGRHVEFGYALGMDRDIDIIVVGPRENVFYCLDWLMIEPTWNDAKKMLFQYS